MKLITASEWRDNMFVGKKRPDMDTVRRWIRNGKIAGQVIGGTYFVHDGETGSTSSRIADQILKS